MEILPWVFTILILIGGVIFWIRIIRNIKDYFLYLPPYLCYVYKGWNAAKKHPEYQSEKNHHAIIVVHKRPSTKPTAYADGVDLLIDFFNKNKEPYKVYHCSNSNDFKRVLGNEKATKLWIFGHGSRHAIGFGKKDRLYYCEVRDYPAKEYIGQFHCNDGMGKSLADYLSPKNNFVSDSLRYTLQNRKAIKKILKDKRY